MLLSRVVLVDEFPDGIQPLEGAMAFGKRNVDFQHSISSHKILGQVRCDTKHPASKQIMLSQHACWSSICRP